MSGHQNAPDPTPAPDPRAGAWERRSVVEATRAAELVRLYETLGFETAVEPIRPADVDERCGDCRLVALGLLVTIYTRRNAAPEARARGKELR